MTSSPPGTVHIFHVRSSDTVARRELVGWKAMADTAASWARYVLVSEKSATGGTGYLTGLDTQWQTQRAAADRRDDLG